MATNAGSCQPIDGAKAAPAALTPTFRGAATAPWRRRLSQALLWIVLLDVAAIAAVGGLKLRRWLYDDTRTIRSDGDIINGYNWGTRASRTGWVALYERLERAHAGEAHPDYGLDYPPLRLAVVMLWARWTQAHFPGVDRWQPDYQFSKPMLWANNLCELASAVAVFLIIRLWVGRSRPSPGWLGGVIRGMTGALLFWFNLGVIWDAHCFPQWDVWILPFFLYALWLASLEWWFAAGLLLGVGALFKGQMLWGAPVLVLWPLFAGRWGGFARICGGVACGVAVATWPWAVREPDGYRWIACIVLAAAMLGAVRLPRRRIWWAVGLVAVAALPLLAYPFRLAPWPWRLLGMLGAAMAIGAACWLPRRRLGHLLATVLATAVFLCVPLYSGSISWFKVGFAGGADKYPVMSTLGSANLCSILNKHFGWHGPMDTVSVDLPLLSQPLQMPLRQLLLGIYVAGLLLCAIGAARHSRHNDRRVLVALVTPWLLFFALMPQMHDRYMVWAAGATALMAGVSVGMTLLHILIGVLTWSMMACDMFRQDPRYWPLGLRILEGGYRGTGWMVLLIAVIFLYVALPRRAKSGLQRQCLAVPSAQRPGHARIC